MEENLEGTYMVKGTCPYCGQIHMFKVFQEPDEETLTKWAIERCDCTGAKEEAENGRKKQRAYENIDYVTREEEKEIAECLKAWVPLIMDGQTEKIQVVLLSGAKIHIAQSKAGGVKVERTVTKKVTMEN